MLRGVRERKRRGVRLSDRLAKEEQVRQGLFVKRTRLASARRASRQECRDGSLDEGSIAHARRLIADGLLKPKEQSALSRKRGGKERKRETHSEVVPHRAQHRTDEVEDSPARDGRAKGGAVKVSSSGDGDRGGRGGGGFDDLSGVGEDDCDTMASQRWLEGRNAHERLTSQELISPVEQIELFDLDSSRYRIPLNLCASKERREGGDVSRFDVEEEGSEEVLGGELASNDRLKPVL
jgi:hypothetical protein